MALLGEPVRGPASTFNSMEEYESWVNGSPSDDDLTMVSTMITTRMMMMKSPVVAMNLVLELPDLRNTSRWAP